MKVETRIEIASSPMFIIVAENEQDRNLLTMIRFSGAKLQFHGNVVQDLRNTSFNFSVVQKHDEQPAGAAP